MQETTAGAVTPTDAIPVEIKQIPNWLVWRLTQKEGRKKPSKVPFYLNGSPRNGEQGSAQDRAQMGTYDQAVAACRAGQYSGIGIAILPDTGLVALDFDACVVDGQITYPDVEVIAEQTYSEFSPSGTGIRAFMTGSVESRKDTKPTAGKVMAEVFGHSGFVTVTGNVTPSSYMWGMEKSVVPLTAEVIQLYTERWGAPAAAPGAVGGMDDNDAWLLGLTPTIGWTPEQASEYLMGCNAVGIDRDTWVKLLMALHHETGGADWALTLADKWSATDTKGYTGFKDVAERWRSFGKRTGASLGGSMLIAYRDKCLTVKKYSTVDQWKKEIKEAASEFEIRESLVKKIKLDTSLGEMEREGLAQALRDAFKLLGTTYPIASCRKLLVVGREKRADSTFDADTEVADIHDDRELPEWVRNWLYVTEIDKFFNQRTGELLTIQGFNAKFNRYQQRDERGQVIVSAHVEANENLEIPVVAHLRYVPWAGQRFVQDGIACVNMYNPASVPVAAGAISEAGGRAIDKMRYHIREVICAGRENQYINMLDYIAHNIQKPGRKIRYMPLVKGVEGDGKSLLLTMMELMIGPRNVNVIGPKVLMSDFNSYAENTCILGVEEIYMVGHNRYDALNAIKPMITNDRVTIHRKGRDSYVVINTVNGFTFTNYANAIPIDDGDRRWWVLFTPFGTKDEMTAFFAPLGGSVKYFAELHDSLRNYSAEMRRFFLDYPISSSFNANGPAPDTDEKRVVIGMSDSDEGQVIADLIESGGPGVTKNAFLSRCLSNAWALTDTEVPIPLTRTLSNCFQRLGFIKQPKRVKWGGVVQSVWTRGKVEDWDGPGGLRELMDASRDQSSVADVLDLF